MAKVMRITPLGPETASGFFVGDGRMITVLSTIDDAPVQVAYGVDARRLMPGEVIASDPYTGLALIEIEGVGDVPPLAPAASDGLAPGDYVYGVGDTGDIAKACAVGRVAGRDRGLGGELLATSVIRLNMRAPEDMAGAPLLDRDARLVGVILLPSGDDPGEPSYALPVELVAKMLADHARHGEVRAPWLGFGMQLGSTTPEIRSLSRGSPAERAGLAVGDVILSIGGRKVQDYQQVIDTCYTLTVGTEVDFRVLRELDDHSIKVVPEARPKAKVSGQSPGKQ